MRVLTIFGLLIFIGCGGQRSSKNKDFVELSDKLPTIQTPISFNSNTEINLKAADFPDNEIIKKLRAINYFSPFGKLFEDENLMVIIGYIPNDTGTPVIATIDSGGKEIDSHLVYETAMGDMGYYSSNYVTIFPDRRICFIDSITTRKINAEGTNEIPGTDSLAVKTKTYKITDKGKIEKVD